MHIVSTNFAKTLVWNPEYDVKLWRHKQRTPNTNDHHIPLTETPHENFLRTPLCWMTHSAVFVAAAALQNKFPLSNKFLRNPGSMQKIYAHGFLVKSFGGCCRSTVLMAASCWPSSNCILAQKIVFVSTGLNHNRAALVLDSDNGVCCHHSSS